MNSPARRNSLVDTWERVLADVDHRLPGDDGLSALRRVRLLRITPSQIHLEAPNRAALLRIVDQYLDALRESIRSTIGPRQVVVDLPAHAQGELFPTARDPPPPRPPERRPPRNRLPPQHTFETFVVGACNQFAHAASKAVAGRPGHSYNPLFIYGGRGLGKTHLATAIGHEILGRTPSQRVAYLSLETFTHELIAALRRNRMDDFRDRFRRADVLIMDDVHLLAGRERTQEEFFHTFNCLYDKRRQVVLTADSLPQDIPDLEQRLCNRFEWGLLADVQLPDVETRVAILEKKAEHDRIILPPDVALFLGQQPVLNVSELEHLLTRVAARASLQHEPLTIAVARGALLDAPRTAMPPTFDRIVNVVCVHFNLRPADLRSRRRSQTIVLPRQVAMYLCRRMLSASYPDLGRMFGRDHSTVLHATSMIGDRLVSDPSFRTTVESLERTLRGE